MLLRGPSACKEGCLERTKVQRACLGRKVALARHARFAQQRQRGLCQRRIHAAQLRPSLLQGTVTLSSCQ